MDIQKRIYNISEMLLVFMLGIILTTVGLFAIGVSVSYINFLVPIMLMVYFRHKFLGGKNYFLQDCIVSLALLAFFILFSGSVYDHTWDGAAYHKTAVGLLKEGWNPFYLSAESYNLITHSIEPARNNPILWAEAYPKATWYFASTVYYLTGNIECGKSYTLIFAFITFGTCMDYFTKKTGKKRAYILSLTAALNPIVLDQFQTYYLDGAVACILTMLAIKFLELLEGVEPEELLQKNISTFILIVWGCNLKFNIALYIATICAVYCICLSLKNKKIQIRSTLLLVLEGGFSIFVMVAAPYITNLKRHGTLFYGLKGMLNGGGGQKSFGIPDLNNVERFWVSVFGRTSHGQYASLQEVLKIPFTFKKEELIYYSIPDARIGAMGVLFSGLFLIATIIFVAVLVKKIKNRAYTISFLYTMMLCIINILEYCFVPWTSQLRYIPHLYLIVVLAMYYVVSFDRSAVLGKILYCVYGALILANLFPWSTLAVQRVNAGIKTTATLKYMGERCQTDDITYQVAFYCDDFTGMVYNLKDYDINFVYTDIADINQEEFHITFSDWLYYKDINY